MDHPVYVGVYIYVLDSGEKLMHGKLYMWIFVGV